MSQAHERIVNLLSEKRFFDPPPKERGCAWICDASCYDDIRKEAIEDSDAFWGKRAEELVHWSTRWDNVCTIDRKSREVRWFEGGRLNVSYNCLDRHLENGRKNKAAIIWQGENDQDVRVYTYQMLHSEVCRFANILKKHGIQKGDRVAIYLPMIPELAVAMLACCRIGAVHTVVFAGFSAASLWKRIDDSGAKMLITADAVVRAGRTTPLKLKVDRLLVKTNSIETCIVVNHADVETPMTPNRDYWYHRELREHGLESHCEPEEVGAVDPFFILYTSGSTGQPKGVVHSTGGYLVYAMHTCQWVFDLKDDDIFWCTADLGWITGHSYLLYGPLGLGATTLMFEGIPSYPGPDRYWQVVEKFRVNILYTAPTVIRALMRYGNEPVDIHDISSLRLLGSVGEPINPEAWMWYYQNIGKNRLPIVDTWWQTETGGIMISPMPFATRLKPGAATQAMPGIDAAILTEGGEEADVNEGGHLVIKKPWPGMFLGLFGDKARTRQEYYEKFPGMYDTGDGARKDEDGYFWIMGRLDDVINVSGHRLGTAEIESVLVAHPDVTEAAVVGVPHSIKGQAIYAYVTLKENIRESTALLKELQEYVKKHIGPIAAPDRIQYAQGLPKTRSGKIMRRVLKKIAADETGDFGDTSALADPSVIDDLIKGKKAWSL